MRIVFMGTPEFAVSSLDSLIKNGYDVVAVVTVPDKPAGRGQQVQTSAVKQYALEKNLPVLQPEKLKDPAFIETLRAYKADLQIVVAFRMLPEVVWDMPPLGTYNLHASLLPKYRGAAPINWAIINGERESGVTTFKLQHQIDTGNILFQEKTPITETMTAGELHDTLMELGAALVLKSVKAIESGDYELKPQNDDAALHAPKIFKDTCRIDWTKPAWQIVLLIRGLSPYPAAFSYLRSKKGEAPTAKIFIAELEVADHAYPSGTPLTDGKALLKVAAEGGYVHIKELQLAGKKRMKTEEFLRGFQLDENIPFS